MLAFFAGKSEFPVRIVPHPIPGKRSGEAERPKRSTVKERRGLQFGPPRMLLTKLPNGFNAFGSSIVST